MVLNYFQHLDGLNQELNLLLPGEKKLYLNQLRMQKMILRMQDYNVKLNPAYFMEDLKLFH